MSSHHFVKEDQEPALVIAQAEAIPFAVVQELLEWSPTVIVLEHALPAVLLWGIKMDVVICQQKNIDQHIQLLNDQAPVKILSHSEEENPLLTALYFLIAGKYRAVNVLGVGHETIAPFTPKLDVVTFYENKRWLYARHGKFEKWLIKGKQISLPEKIKSKEGLDEHGVAVHDGTVKVISDVPFWIGEEI
ncbi:MAG TPA: hypothetical protein PLV21_12175 [Cyclobacteriaceae bacterium]|nr:hypothetical protein [Cyclobacteriaceae bacterium]HRJ82638.1 hypothetical protein [Cyclobacteriaceae bacterium]